MTKRSKASPKISSIPIKEDHRKRYLSAPIQSLVLAHKKILLLSGPRQGGKTTLGKSLLDADKLYFNWDRIETKKKWQGGSSEFANEILSHRVPRVLLDEFHKNPKWKNQLKGLYDQFGKQIEIMVTGSAQLNQFRKGADSLLGRYFHFTLLPYSLGELLKSEGPRSFSDIETFIESLNRNVKIESQSKDKAFERNQLSLRLWEHSGFPEPFEKSDLGFTRLWSQSRAEALVRQDVKDISILLQHNQIEILASYLPDRIGSPLSVQNLREDLDVAHTTVSRWLKALEMVYFHFSIFPYTKSIPRTLKKEPKVYLFDWTAIPNSGARFENMVAFHLKKFILYYSEIGEAKLELFYLRNKEKNEIDFLVTKAGKPYFTLEAKLSDLQLDKSHVVFQKRLQVPHFQVVQTQGIHRVNQHEFGFSSVISFDLFFSRFP